MKINKPKFWDQKISLFSLALLPFTVIVKLITVLKKKLIKGKKFNIPVICIGNIYLGGTGKTPTAILIANELVKIGKKPSIVRKYYADQEDEYNLIIVSNRIEIIISSCARFDQQDGQNNTDLSY